MKTTELSDYSDEEFDAEFLRSQRSDAPYVAFRLATIAIVFWFMGRAIASHDLTAGMLLLPLAVELLAVMWIGFFLSRWVVDCPVFARACKGPGLIVGWTIFLAAIVCVVLAVDDGTFEITRIPSEFRSAWSQIVDSGLLWAFVVQTIAPLFSVWPDVRRWKRVGGSFFWTETFESGLRFAALFLLGFLFVFLLVFGADLFGEWLFDRPRRVAWLVFVFLLFVELGGLAIGVGMHRDLRRAALADSGPS